MVTYRRLFFNTQSDIFSVHHRLHLAKKNVWTACCVHTFCTRPNVVVGYLVDSDDVLELLFCRDFLAITVARNPLPATECGQNCLVDFTVS